MASANILVNQNISVLRINILFDTELVSVRLARIRRTHHQNGMLLAPVFRLVNGSEQFDTVAHRDHDFPFGVMLSQLKFGTVYFTGLLLCIQFHPEQTAQQACQQHTFYVFHFSSVILLLYSSDGLSRRYVSAPFSFPGSSGKYRSRQSPDYM